jgi:hypothetical protein
MVASVTFAQETKKQSKWVIGVGANFIDDTNRVDNNFVNVSIGMQPWEFQNYQLNIFIILNFQCLQSFH